MFPLSYGYGEDTKLTNSNSNSGEVVLQTVFLQVVALQSDDKNALLGNGVITAVSFPGFSSAVPSLISHGRQQAAAEMSANMGGGLS